jgi:hypothetical protein
MKKIIYTIILLNILLLTSCTTLKQNGTKESQDANIQVFNTGINRLNLSFNNPTLLDLGSIDYKWKAIAQADTNGNYANYDLKSKAITFSNTTTQDLNYLTPFNNTQWLRFECENNIGCGGGGNAENYTIKAVYTFCYSTSNQMNATNAIRVKGFMDFHENFTNNIVHRENREIYEDYKIKRVTINGVELNTLNDETYNYNYATLHNGLNTLEIECYTWTKPDGNFNLYLNVQGDILLLNKCSN